MRFKIYRIISFINVPVSKLHTGFMVTKRHLEKRRLPIPRMTFNLETGNVFDEKSFDCGNSLTTTLSFIIPYRFDISFFPTVRQKRLWVENTVHFGEPKNSLISNNQGATNHFGH